MAGTADFPVEKGNAIWATGQWVIAARSLHWDLAYVIFSLWETVWKTKVRVVRVAPFGLCIEGKAGGTLLTSQSFEVKELWGGAVCTIDSIEVRLFQWATGKVRIQHRRRVDVVECVWWAKFGVELRVWGRMWGYTFVRNNVEDLSFLTAHTGLFGIIEVGWQLALHTGRLWQEWELLGALLFRSCRGLADEVGWRRYRLWYCRVGFGCIGLVCIGVGYVCVGAVSNPLFGHVDEVDSHNEQVFK